MPADTVTDDLVAEIATRFGLPGPKSWQVLSSSWTTNLLLDFTDGSRVARVHQPWTDHDRLAAIQLVRRAANRAGLPTVPPIPDARGETIITLASGALAELEPYAVWDQRMKTPDLLVRGFAALGRLHDVLEGLDLPFAALVAPRANHLGFEHAAALTRQGAERIRDWHDPILSTFADEVVVHINAVTAAERAYAQQQISQLVHGDFWDNNVLFAGDDLAALIDFDFMAVRWRIDDLALPIWFSLLEPDHGLPDDHDLDLVRRLVDAYDSGTTRPLSRSERLALPLAIARQPAWSVGRWVVQLDEEDARRHARSAAEEFPVARQIMINLRSWQAALEPQR